MTKVTGWDNGLSQDYDKGLGRWFANRLGARQQLRQDFEMKQLLIDRATLEQLVEFLEFHSKYWNGQGTHPMTVVTAGRAALANAERVEPAKFVDLKEQARRGCGNCFYQDCDYPNCITKRKQP